jgi:hypothetical protein
VALEEGPAEASALEQMFAYQEALRRERLGIPLQRGHDQA